MQGAGASGHLLDGGRIPDGVDAAAGAQHPAELVRHDAPEVRLGALREPLL